jgi:tryptophan-rich sensory protein
MNPFAILIGIALAALAVLSLRSLQFTWKHSPWTSVGWAATLAYCLYDVARLAFVPEGQNFGVLPHADWGLLLLLTIAFIVAGVRDERQAEPWYWPRGRGATRGERTGKPRV